MAFRAVNSARAYRLAPGPWGRQGLRKRFSSNEHVDERPFRFADPLKPDPTPPKFLTMELYNSYGQIEKGSYQTVVKAIEARHAQPFFPGIDSYKKTSFGRWLAIGLSLMPSLAVALPVIVSTLTDPEQDYLSKWADSRTLAREQGWI